MGRRVPLSCAIIIVHLFAVSIASGPDSVIDCDNHPPSDLPSHFLSLSDDIQKLIASRLPLKYYIRLGASSRALCQLLPHSQADLPDLVLVTTVFEVSDADPNLPNLIGLLNQRARHHPPLQRHLEALSDNAFCTVYDRILALKLPELTQANLLAQVQYGERAAALFHDLYEAFRRSSLAGCSFSGSFDRLTSFKLIPNRSQALRDLGVDENVIGYLFDRPHLSESLQTVVVLQLCKAGQAHLLFDRRVVRALLAAGIRLQAHFVMYYVECRTEQLEPVLPLYAWCCSPLEGAAFHIYLSSLRLLVMPGTETTVEVFWSLPMVRDFYRTVLGPWLRAQRFVHVVCLLNNLEIVKFPFLRLLLNTPFGNGPYSILSCPEFATSYPELARFRALYGVQVQTTPMDLGTVAEA